jgi:hypothetical protein
MDIAKSANQTITMNKSKLRRIEYRYISHYYLFMLALYCQFTIDFFFFFSFNNSWSKGRLPIPH